MRKMKSSIMTMSVWVKVLCVLFICNFSLDLLVTPVRGEPQETEKLKLEDFKIINELLPGYAKIPDYVESMEYYNKPVDMYSGRLTVDPDYETKQFFFWKVNTRTGSQDKLIIWLNGGPGCSSMDGALLENGPFNVDSNGRLIANDGSWHMYSDIVYVDQPLGTGFSYRVNGEQQDNDGGTRLKDLEFYDKNIQDELNIHFTNFLLNYFELFPKDLGKEIILSGESYAGQYIIHFINYLTDLMDQGKLDINLNLKKILLGNAWVDPMEQGLSYLAFLKQESLINENNPYLKDLLERQEICQNQINGEFDAHVNDFNIGPCEAILSLAADAAVEDQGKCLNVYDYRLIEPSPSCGADWPYDLPNIPKFFSREGVMEALHLSPSHRWQECNGVVSYYLQNQQSTPAIRILPQVLEKDIQVYLFNGDKDIVCNSLGVWNYAQKLKWNEKQFDHTQKTNKHMWYHDNVESGFFYKDRNLMFLNIYNSSHMVPVDKPLEARGMLNMFDMIEQYDLEYENFDVFTSNKRNTDELDPDANYIRFDRGESVDDNNSEEEPYTGQDDNQQESETADNDELVKTFIPNPVIYIALILISCFTVRYIVNTLYYKSNNVFQRLDNTNDSNDFDNEDTSKRKKTVTWADDIENNTLGENSNDFELDDEFDVENQLELGEQETTPRN